MVARVNGEERSRGNLADLYHSWDAIVAQAARNTRPPSRRRSRLRHGRDGLHPRARRRAVAPAWRRRGTRGRRHRHPAQPCRLTLPQGETPRGVDMENLLSIGEFASASQLSQKALRLYGENALLPPAWVDPDSGYRYYDAGPAARGDADRVAATHRNGLWPTSARSCASRPSSGWRIRTAKWPMTSPNDGGFSAT